MLRVKRFAAAMDMMAAGTRAPMPTAANATPANQPGNILSNSSGTTVLLSTVPCVAPASGLIPAAIAMYPSSAIRPSRNEYAGSADMFRLITSRFRLARTPVMLCGYRKSANADPNASVTYCHWLVPLSRMPSVGTERDDDRQVPGQRVVPGDAHGLEDRLDAHQLQRDVGHRGDDAGDGDHQGEGRRAEPGPHEVRRGHEAVPVRHRPEAHQDQERHRIDDDRVRDGEEAERAAAEQQRGHGDERVRGVQVTADEEPGDPAAEVAPSSGRPAWSCPRRRR